MSIVHLITGPTGAGKTTYTLKLAQTQNAVHFSIDLWMQTLFHPDLPGEIRFEWMMERINRCEAQIWAVCRQLLARNTEVILDLGLSKFSHREKFRRLAAAENVPVRLHYVTAPQHVRRERVAHRNTHKPHTFAIEVTPEMFNFMEEWFEPPQGTELAGGVVVDIASGQYPVNQ